MAVIETECWSIGVLADWILNPSLQYSNLYYAEASRPAQPTTLVVTFYGSSSNVS